MWSASEIQSWRIAWLRSIQEFSDFEMQRATWLNPANDNPHYTFSELMFCYHESLRFVPDPYGQAVEDGRLSPAHVEAVSEFRAVLMAYEPPTQYSVRYGDQYDEAAILRDPKWLEVVAAAQSARDRLMKLLDGPRERKALTRRSIHARLAAARSPLWRRVLATWISLTTVLRRSGILS